MISPYRAILPNYVALPREWARRIVPFFLAATLPALSMSEDVPPSDKNQALRVLEDLQRSTSTPHPRPQPALLADKQAIDGIPSWSGAPLIVTAAVDRYAVPTTSAATRTETPLIQVPQSVQVLTRALMDEQDRRTLTDALVNVSGVTPTRPEESLFTSPIVRGFPAEIYQDGLPMYGSAEAANDPTSLVGIARVDVLKGPTSTLYGGGVGSPLGGLINIESERPSDVPGGFLAMRSGSYATVDPYGEVNVPLSSTIAARLAGEYESNDSWIDKVKAKRGFVQPSISFQLTPQTDLLLQGQYSRRSELEYSGLPAEQALAGQVNRDAFPGAPDGQPQTTTKNRMATATLRHAFDDDVRLASSVRTYNSRITQYGSFIYPENNPAEPATPTVYPILPVSFLTQVKENTFDVNVTANADILGGRHNFLAGFDYDRTRFSSYDRFDGLPVGTLDLADPIYNLAFGGPLPIDGSQTDRYQTTAFYLQDQANYGRLHLTGSLRYTWLDFREAEQHTDAAYRRLSPRVGATFDLLPGLALYTGYATAFRGAFGLMSMAAVKPETSSNVEAGLKFDMTAVGLSGTLAAFEQKRNNVATPDPNNPMYSLQAGQQRSRGIETDLVWEPVPSFSLLANAAYTEAEVTRDNILPVGDNLPRVPRRSGRLAARYRILDGAARGLAFGAGVTAFSARDITLPNTVSAPGYAMMDTQASYDFSRYTVAVSIVNLAGRRTYDTYQYLAFPVVIPVQPRSAYLSLKVNF
jgi:iron complex outermembrane receptor protein